MRVLFILPLSLIIAGLNALLSSRIVIGDKPLPPLGRFLSPQEGFWCNAEPLRAVSPASMRLAGLSAPVQVVWDDHGIPHLFATNDADLYRAQGFIVASQRLWQMDFIARAAAGRISEVVGPVALEFDRAQRRKGMLIGAEASSHLLEQDSLMNAILSAYADGANQWIAGLRYRDLPVEYKLMHYRPEPWSPFRSALVQQYMVENLSGHDRDVEDTHARRVLGGSLFELLFPERPPGVVPTVPTDSLWPFVPDTIAPPPHHDPGAGFTADPFRPDPANGSNNWAVHGSRTATGRPLLANDTHLGLNFPPIWFPVQLSTPDHQVFGFALPGACGVVMGHNEHAAWGVTNAPRDTRDWYRITWRDGRKLEYRFGDAWLPVQWRVERIAVRGGAEVTDSIRITRHGPVMFDERFGTHPQRHHLALRWLGHEGSRTQRALYLMNRARSHADYVEALRYFDTPAQNWVFACTDGTIAMRVQGRFPNKWRGQGRFVLDGADPAHEWQGFIPHEHTATQVNPARGFVSSANQHSVDERYPYWFFNRHLEYYRNRRINAVLGQDRRFTAEDMMALQHDGFDLRAAEALAVMLPMLDTTRLEGPGREVYRLLRDWDRTCRHEGEEAALQHLWFDSLRADLWGPLERHPLPIGDVNSYNTVRILADAAARARVEAFLRCDIRALVNEAFAKVVRERTARGRLPWREVNDARVQHLARLEPFGRSQLPVNGSGTAVNAQRGGHGPSQRIVVDLSSPPKAWFQLPGGVSGNPGSPRYDDLLEEWTTMRYREVRFLRDAEEGRTQHAFATTVLQP